MDDDTLELRARSRAAADLAAKSRDKDVATLLLIVSEELEEEACRLEKGGPQLAEGRPTLRGEQQEETLSPPQELPS